MDDAHKKASLEALKHIRSTLRNRRVQPKTPKGPAADKPKEPDTPKTEEKKAD